MIDHYLALMKREFWEHRSIWVTPAAIASIVTLGTVTALAFAGDFAKELDVAIFGAQNIAGDAERRAVLTGLFLGSSWLFLLGLGVLTIFYALDSLYAERKDKSILFWRSLPVTDAETVVSKLATAIVLIPAVAVVAIIATHLVNLIITSLWVSMKGGDAGVLIWGSVPLLDNWLATAISVFGMALWMSPFLGWFLFVSAWTKRAPLLMAFLPLVLIPMIEGIFFRSTHFGEAVWGRGAKIPLFAHMDIERFFDEGHPQVSDEMISLLGHIDLGRFFASVDLWLGIVVCALLTTAAIYVRRYRDES
ncbi:MAG: ABC-2 transporter permease [Proteobacteria bacterium]|nr:ABC-2 transporter permease [Pseudomonadota bacterium]